MAGLRKDKKKNRQEEPGMKYGIILPVTLTVALYSYLCSLTAFAQHGPGGSHGGGGAGNHGASAMSHRDSDTTGGKGAETSSRKQLTNVINSSTSSSPSKLAQKLTAMLPTTGPNAGLTLPSASTGFKNLGRFVAALHAYNNLGLASQNPPVSFSTFASKVNSSSLGKAIKTYRSDIDATAEVKKANKEAHRDMTESGPGS